MRLAPRCNTILSGCETYRVHIHRALEQATSQPARRTPLTIALGIAMAQALQVPYAVPNFTSLSSSSWPSSSEWASLNDSVSGRLQALRPWAAVCYTSDPLYNADECQSVLSGYTNDTQASLNILCIPCILTRSHFSAKQFPRPFCGRTGSRAATTKVVL